MLLPGSVLWHNNDIYSARWERGRGEGGREGKKGSSKKINSNSSVFFVEFCNIFSKYKRGENL